MVRVGPEIVEPGWLALVPPGVDELPVAARGDARFLLLGGDPPRERIEMWWNFVARDKDELTAAWRDWRDRTDRFGEVATGLERIEAPVPPGLPQRSCRGGAPPPRGRGAPTAHLRSTRRRGSCIRSR